MHGVVLREPFLAFLAQANLKQTTIPFRLTWGLTDVKRPRRRASSPGSAEPLTCWREFWLFLTVSTVTYLCRLYESREDRPKHDQTTSLKSCLSQPASWHRFFPHAVILVAGRYWQKYLVHTSGPSSAQTCSALSVFTVIDHALARFAPVSSLDPALILPARQARRAVVEPGALEKIAQLGSQLRFYIVHTQLANYCSIKALVYTTVTNGTPLDREGHDGANWIARPVQHSCGER